MKIQYVFRSLVRVDMEVSTAASALVHEANRSGGRGVQLSRDYAAKPPSLVERYPVKVQTSISYGTCNSLQLFSVGLSRSMNK